MQNRAKKKVLFVFPTIWDKRQLEHCRSVWENEYEALFTEPTDEECPWDFDVFSFIESTVANWKGKIAGVMSSSDYPGATVAGAIAMRLGLPGSDPGLVMRSSHKYYSRIAQREAVPDATPAFSLIDPDRRGWGEPTIGFPFFIKPVKGAFSMLARRIDTAAELDAYLARATVREFIRDYVRIFNQLVGRLTDFEINGSYFIAEEIVGGNQVTVEGFSCGGEIEIIGVVDSIRHPEKGSFLRFDYPSSIEEEVQRQMGDIARRVIRNLGLTESFFNIEMLHDSKTGRIHIIEVNPRMCGQFADLYEKVDGVNSYALALELASGARPALRRRQGRFEVAASIPLRVFDPVRVVRAPDEYDIREAESMYSGTQVWVECATGQELVDFESIEDGSSCRYAIINAGASDIGELTMRVERIRSRLGFEFA